MNIVLFCPQYPSPTFHGYSFVHARAKLYQQYGHKVLGVYLAKKSTSFQTNNSYIYEGITVKAVTKSDLKKCLEDFAADVIAVHFPLVPMISALKHIKIPQVAWIHGHEILWKFRLGASKNFFDWIKKRLVLIPREFFQIQSAKRYINSISTSVFVSKWMLAEAEKHAFGKFKNSIIIPNPVDTDKFSFQEINVKNKGISFRGFDNTKYGLDLIIKALSNNNEIEVDLVGKGRFYKKFLNMKKKLNSNVNVIEKSIPHNEVSTMYSNYNFFVAPSRVEAQGLSMCEAMSCGLPVVATSVGGIPEFVRDGVDGILVSPDNPKELFKAIKSLNKDHKKLKQMGKNARENILNICSKSVITSKELEILEKAKNEKE